MIKSGCLLSANYYSSVSRSRIKMDPASSSTSNLNRTAAPSKPKIDPLQLLKCLSILLNDKGGIKGETEVPRIEGLMAKYSKKLVSKCIYLNILQATDLVLLDAFYDEGGWELVGDWLQEAVNSNNWPLAEQVLNLLDVSPMTITRLKRYNTPKLIKELSKECSNPDVQSLAKHVLLKWMEIVRENDSNGFASANNSLSSMDVDEPEDVSDGKAIKNEMEEIGQSGSAATPINVDSSHEGGDGSSSMEGQDDSSNASTESDITPAPTTPIRITIRSGSQVLAKVSSQRFSLDSNDSDDNKPLSVIKKEVQKAKSKESGGSSASSTTSTASEETHIPPVTDSKSQDISTSGTSEATSVAPAATTTKEASTPVSSADSSSSENSGAVSASSSTTPIFTVVTSTGSLAVSAPPPSTQETANSEEVHGKTSKSDDEISNKTVNSDNEEKPPQISDNMGDTEGKDEKTDSKKEKEHKSNKDKSKDKSKDKESDKKDRKDKEREKEKDRERDKDRDRDKEREKDKKHRDDKRKDRDKEHSKSSKSSSSKSREKDKNSKDHERSKSDKERSGSSHSKSSKDKDRDRDKSRSSSRDKDRRISSSKEKSKDKEKDEKHDRDKDKKKEQENEDKATLEKVKPLSADGLAKIPRKNPASFLDALGSADEFPEAKKPSVKTYKSRGFRNTGLLDEPTKLPGKKSTGGGMSEKKANTGPGSQGVKRPSPLDELVASLPDKRLKSSVSSTPNTTDKPGGVKLISPKRPSLSDDGGFMAALTAAGPDRKKVTRKRRSSEGDSKDGKNDGKEEDGKKDDEKSPNSSPIKTEDKGMLSPTSVKPTFNFYQDTLKDDDEKEKKEDKEEAKDEKGAENGDVEMKEEEGSKNQDDDMDIEESIKDEDIPIAPAVPAPAQEDYEKVEVTFSDPNPTDVRGVLVYHRPENRKKKSVRWKAEEDLQEMFFFDLDETERVNVNTIKFTEMMVLEKQREREAMGKNRGMHGAMMGGGMNMMGSNHMMGMGMHPGHQNVIEFERWSLLPIMIPSPSKVIPGCNSQERKIQAARESSTMAAFYHPAMVPDTPREPDPEMVPREEPKIIPLSDVTGQDIIYDHRGKMWPEPMFGEPPSFGFSGMGGPPSSGSDAGSHWVVGGPPAGGFPGPTGPPMYGGPGGFGGPGMSGPGMSGPGMSGPGMSGPGMTGPGMTGPGNFGGDMGGGMDVQQGWGGPPGPGPGPGPGLGPGPGMDYPNQNMMMGNNNQGMMMGGGGGPRGGPRGMMHNMGMGGPNFRGGRGGPGGGNWGPGPSNYNKPPVCKHHMNGHCRHGKNCRFLHIRH